MARSTKTTTTTTNIPIRRSTRIQKKVDTKVIRSTTTVRKATAVTPPMRKSKQVKKRKATRKAQKTSTEPSFKKFPVMCFDLRELTLSYLSEWDLLKYSQCSKSCNSDIQKFKKRAPDALSLLEKDNGVEVVLEYDSWRHWNLIRKSGKTFLFKDHPNVANEIVEYLKPKLRFLPNKSISTITIDMKTWLQPVMELTQISEVGSWQVVMYPSMYDDFVDFTKSDDRFIKVRNLVDTEQAKNNVNRWPECFKNINIQNLSVFFDASNDAVQDEPFFEYQISKMMTRQVPKYIRHLNTIECPGVQYLRLVKRNPDEQWCSAEDLFHRYPADQFISGKRFVFDRVAGDVDEEGEAVQFRLYPTGMEIPSDEFRVPRERNYWY